jgi:hypothetical protein
MADIKQQLIDGIDKAKAGEWEAAHGIAQSHEGDRHADWFHAILHKIEGDASNSRYWYAKTDKNYDMFPDAEKELAALRAALLG